MGLMVDKVDFVVSSRSVVINLPVCTAEPAHQTTSIDSSSILPRADQTTSSPRANSEGGNGSGGDVTDGRKSRAVCTSQSLLVSRRKQLPQIKQSTTLAPVPPCSPPVADPIAKNSTPPSTRSSSGGGSWCSKQKFSGEPLLLPVAVELTGVVQPIKHCRHSRILRLPSKYTHEPQVRMQGYQAACYLMRPVPTRKKPKSYKFCRPLLLSHQSDDGYNCGLLPPVAIRLSSAETGSTRQTQKLRYRQLRQKARAEVTAREFARRQQWQCASKAK